MLDQIQVVAMPPFINFPICRDFYSVLPRKIDISLLSALLVSLPTFDPVQADNWLS